MRAGYVRVSPSLFSGLAAAPAPITGLGLSPCLSANAALPPPIGGWAFGDSAGGGAFYAMFVGYRCGELRKTLRWSFDEIAADRSIVMLLVNDYENAAKNMSTAAEGTRSLDYC